MKTYKIIKFDANELVAITVTDEGVVQRWGTFYKTKTSKVFQDKYGRKAILYLHPYWDFETDAKKADYCKYAQLWYGDYPYGSWCWAIRKCLISNKVKIWEICTDINPRGLSSSDYWIEECKSYVPGNVVADLIAT